MPDYKDITSRLGEPLWYDGRGVPRYDPFRLEMCDVYANYVAFAEVECQACGRRFSVAVEVNKYDWLNSFSREVQFPGAADEGDFHYGDPPKHEAGGSLCPGATMSCTTRKIIEFWVRDTSTGYRWVRKSEYEFEYRGEGCGDGE